MMINTMSLFMITVAGEVLLHILDRLYLTIEIIQVNDWSCKDSCGVKTAR
jgi:hypothetical protein